METNVITTVFNAQEALPINDEARITKAQILFQIVHAAGDIGLVIAQYLRSPCKAFVLGDVVKNAVIIVRYCQNLHLFVMLLRYS